MAIGRIKITDTLPPELTFNVDGINIVPVASTVSMPSDYMEYPMQDRSGFRKLTWRDFTIDMSPFDHKFEMITHIEIIEYGVYDVHNIENTTPHPNDYPNGCLKKELSISAPAESYLVGNIIDVQYNNITNPDHPSMVRHDSINPKIYIRLEHPNSNTPDYVKVRVYYNGIPSTKIKTIYTYNSFGTPPMIGSFLESAIIEVKSDSIYPITGSSLLSGLDYFVSPWNNINTELDFESQVIGISPIKETLEAIYPSIYQYLPRGNPAKITIWDSNSGDSRILVNGIPLVNGMSIPFETFNQGFVLFNALDMAPNSTYQVHLSVMDLATGLLVFKTR